MKTYTPHTIRLRLPNARQVALVGDFNNWHSNAHPLIQVAADLWERIIDLPPGKHRYAFFIIDDLAIAQGNVRSRIIANGSVLYVPDSGDHSLSITAHHALTLARVA